MPSSGSSDVAALPEGTVTFLFSDVEGSTRLLEAYGEASGRALLRHHQLFQTLIDRHRGVIFETVGDAVYAAFGSAPDAVAAALDVHRAMAAEPWDEVGGRLACRIALHTGAVERRGQHYFGPPLFRCARLEALAYGEQTVLSAATASLAATDLPPGARLIDQGIHQLKDLQEPEHVYELQHPDLRTDFPPLKSLSARPHNLPIQLSTFVGRAQDLAAASELVRSHRLVTLLGPGGMGKTRLALQLAADQIDAFPDGAWFVDLSAVTDPARISAQIAGVMHIHEDPSVPVEDGLAARLIDRKALLILDNLEQVLPEGARAISSLMSRASDIHVLATSRKPLRVRGEVEYEVLALDAGDPERADDLLPDAVALFLARAREIQPDLVITPDTGPLIAGICSRLDGLPLAIELAAARLRLFSLRELHDRLAKRLSVLIGGAADLPERHQTLQATIAWSDDLLHEAERALFYRLGAFVDTFGLEGACAVMPEADEAEVEQRLTSLIEHSLVRSPRSGVGRRFAMLETVREYAVGRLADAGERDATASRIAAFHVAMATDTREHLIGHGQQEAHRSLTDELPNIRASLAWLRDSDDDRLPLLVALLGRFWPRAGLSREGLHWTQVALSHEATTPTPVRAMLLQAHASMLADSEPDRAADAYRAAMTIYTELGDTKELGRTQLGLSNALFNAGALQDSLAEARGAQSKAIATGDSRTEAAAMGNAATAALHLGRIDEAEAAISRAVDMFQATGDLFGVVLGLGNLGDISLRRGDVEGALDRHQRAMDFARELGDPALLGWEMTNLAGSLSADGRHAEAIPLMVDGMQKLHEANDLRSVVAAMVSATSVLSAAGDQSAAAEAWMLASSLSRSLGLPIEDWAAEQARRALGDASKVEISQEVSLESAMQRVTDRLRGLLG